MRTADALITARALARATRYPTPEKCFASMTRAEFADELESAVATLEARIRRLAALLRRRRKG